MADTPDIQGGDNSYRAAADELRSFCERIERLESEKAALADDIKDVKAEAAARGYDKTVLGEMLKLRKLDPDERNEREALRELYADALGIFG